MLKEKKTKFRPSSHRSVFRFGNGTETFQNHPRSSAVSEFQFFYVAMEDHHGVDSSIDGRPGNNRDRFGNLWYGSLFLRLTGTLQPRHDGIGWVWTGVRRILLGFSGGFIKQSRWFLYLLIYFAEMTEPRNEILQSHSHFHISSHDCFSFDRNVPTLTSLGLPGFGRTLQKKISK